MFPLNILHEPMRPFSTHYRCYSIMMLPGNERHDVEKGGKIIMPPSALDHLTRLNIVYPMLFKLTNTIANRITHCGVLEFVAEEGKVFLPNWMMRNLCLEEGDLILIESASLPVATFSKFQPSSSTFLDISNPKAVLENALRNFACLTTGDLVVIQYNNKMYELLVLETKPGNAVSIIECDMNVDFDKPMDYVEPEPMTSHSSEQGSVPDLEEFESQPKSFEPFRCKGNRLDGKEKGLDTSQMSTNKGTYKRGIPDYDYEIGTLRFLRVMRPDVNGTEDKKDEPHFQAFTGEGQVLRKKKTR